MTRENALHMQLTALVGSMREKIDTALAALQPGQRMCLHPPGLGVRSDDLADLYTMRIRLEYHYLGEGQHCDAPNRTEYTRT